jgi:hypothetical protein
VAVTFAPRLRKDLAAQAMAKTKIIYLSNRPDQKK